MRNVGVTQSQVRSMRSLEEARFVRNGSKTAVAAKPLSRHCCRRRRSAMASFQMQIETEYPVLFLSSGGDDVVTPGDTGSSFGSATPTCLSFWVLAYVDGASA